MIVIAPWAIFLMGAVIAKGVGGPQPPLTALAAGRLASSLFVFTCLQRRDGSARSWLVAIKAALPATLAYVAITGVLWWGLVPLVLK